MEPPMLEVGEVGEAAAVVVPLGPGDGDLTVLDIGLGMDTAMMVAMMTPMALMEVTVVEMMSSPGFAVIANAKNNLMRQFA